MPQVPTVLEDIDGVQVSGGVATKYAINNVNDTTPTQAEILTSFGASAVADITNAKLCVCNDANGNTNLYLFAKAGTKTGWLKFTVAV